MCFLRSNHTKRVVCKINNLVNWVAAAHCCTSMGLELAVCGMFTSTKKSIHAVRQINSVTSRRGRNMESMWKRKLHKDENIKRKMSLKHVKQQSLLLQTFCSPCLWITTLTQVKMSHRGGVLVAQWSQARRPYKHVSAKSWAWIQRRTFITGHSFSLPPVVPADLIWYLICNLI